MYSGSVGSTAYYVRFETGTATARWGLLNNDRIQPLNSAPYSGAAPSGAEVALADTRLLAPVEPRKIFAIGLNYRSHLGSRPEPKTPEVFYKPVTCLQDPGVPIEIPHNASDVHYEGELVLVIGRRAKRVAKEDALSYIFGVTCGNDVSERDWQRGPNKDLQWWRAKGADTFGPCGPWIITGLNFGDLLLTTRLNGDIVQQQRTSDLIFDAATIVSVISQNVTLEPGDLIFTGTPGNTKALKSGDRVSVEIEGIGTLENPVVQAE